MNPIPVYTRAIGRGLHDLAVIVPDPAAGSYAVAISDGIVAAYADSEFQHSVVPTGTSQKLSERVFGLYPEAFGFSIKETLWFDRAVLLASIESLDDDGGQVRVDVYTDSSGETGIIGLSQRHSSSICMSLSGPTGDGKTFRPWEK